MLHFHLENLLPKKSHWLTNTTSRPEEDGQVAAKRLVAKYTLPEEPLHLLQLALELAVLAASSSSSTSSAPWSGQVQTLDPRLQTLVVGESIMPQTPVAIRAAPWQELAVANAKTFPTADASRVAMGWRHLRPGKQTGGVAGEVAEAPWDVCL